MGDTHTVSDEAIRQACLAFGYTALSRKQEMAVRGFLSGKDVFVMLPTGSGKSLCYSALPILFDKTKHRSGHIVLVVSPLTRHPYTSYLNVPYVSLKECLHRESLGCSQTAHK